jgi:DNA (cytosine-5)-methyltransferase 1
MNGNKKITVLSLFSGCGGLDLGFTSSGYNLVEAYDNWGPAVLNHRKNGHLLGGKVYQKSLALDDGEVSLNDFPNVDVVLGGPPCQGFSFAGKQILNDPRNSLYLDFLKIVHKIRPKVFLMENVRGLEAMALDNIKEGFDLIDYKVCVDRAKAINIGIPQRRERIIIVGTRKGEKHFETPDALIGGLFSISKPRNILDNIGDLPAPKPVLKENGSSEHYLDDHSYLKLSDEAQRFIRRIPNGGFFRDAPRELLPQRLRKIYDEPLKYKSPRLFPKADPYKPAQTIPASTSPSIGGVIAPDFDYSTGKGIPINPLDHTKNGVYTSPYPSRRFTPREAARLQTFPDDYLFIGSFSTKIRLIGNAVPVKLAKFYADEIRKQLF